MTKDEYTMQMDLLVAQARIVAEIDLEGLLDVISKSETVGPLLEPTLWTKGGSENLRAARELVEAALPLKRALVKLREEALQHV